MSVEAEWVLLRLADEQLFEILQCPLEFELNDDWKNIARRLRILDRRSSIPNVRREILKSLREKLARRRANWNNINYEYLRILVKFYKIQGIDMPECVVERAQNT